MKSITKEYRVVATQTHGRFMCFGPNLSKAESFLEGSPNIITFQGSLITRSVPSSGRLQWRDDSNQGDDSTWTDFTPEEHAVIYQKNVIAAQTVRATSAR